MYVIVQRDESKAVYGNVIVLDQTFCCRAKCILIAQMSRSNGTMLVVLVTVTLIQVHKERAQSEKGTDRQESDLVFSHDASAMTVECQDSAGRKAMVAVVNGEWNRSASFHQDESMGENVSRQLNQHHSRRAFDTSDTGPRSET
jgi:hypothetical protein